MATFKCKMCGASLDVENSVSVVQCDYCGSKQTLPNLDDERRANLYDRANHFRRNNEFDKAISIFEQILNEDKTDAEAYWSLVLCKYGVEYVEDPATHKRLPTIHRAQFTSIFDDEDYKSALQYADGYQKDVYQSEAKALNEIQKGILAISQNEDPFDVFICYKETDANGRRTHDSVLANDLYHELTQEGFKVFFARITLEDKLGSAYEPYIFAALNSAKVMVVLGTKPEHFNAVWVKNEWSRYLALIKGGAKKALIPAYKDMDAYDLPDEFAHLQAQDMSKLGFMQDLIRGIKKLAADSKKKTTETVVVSSGSGGNVNALLKRAFMFLEDGDYDSAYTYCEKVLDINPECARAYLGKMLADLKLHTYDDLNKLEGAFSDNDNYRKFMRFASKSEAADLERINKEAIQRKEQAVRNQNLAELKKIISTTNDYETLMAAIATLKGKFPDKADVLEQAQQHVKRVENLCLQQQIFNLKRELKNAESNYKNAVRFAEEETRQIAIAKRVHEDAKKRYKGTCAMVAIYVLFFLGILGAIFAFLYPRFAELDTNWDIWAGALLGCSFIAMFVMGCIEVKRAYVGWYLIVAYFLSPPIGLIWGLVGAIRGVPEEKDIMNQTERSVRSQEERAKFQQTIPSKQKEMWEYIDKQINSLEELGVKSEYFKPIANYSVSIDNQLAEQSQASANTPRLIKNPDEIAGICLTLTAMGSDKINAIKVVREITNMGLADAKYLVENLPKTIGPFATTEDAEYFAAKFRKTGGIVEVINI